MISLHIWTDCWDSTPRVQQATQCIGWTSPPSGHTFTYTSWTAWITKGIFWTQVHSDMAMNPPPSVSILEGMGGRLSREQRVGLRRWTLVSTPSPLLLQVLQLPLSPFPELHQLHIVACFLLSPDLLHVRQEHVPEWGDTLHCISFTAYGVWHKRETFILLNLSAAQILPGAVSREPGAHGPLKTRYYLCITDCIMNANQSVRSKKKRTCCRKQ